MFSKLTFPSSHKSVLDDVTIEIFTREKTYTRAFKNLDAPYVKIFNHNKVTFPTPYKGLPNTSENVMVGLDDMENKPFDNYTDVLIQVTQNVWGFDMDIILMGAYRKKVYFRNELLADSDVARYTWVPLFKQFPDLKGTVEYDF